MPAVTRGLPMIRWLLWLLGGLLLGGIVHLVERAAAAAHRDAGRLCAPRRRHAGQQHGAAAGADAGRARCCRSWIRPSPVAVCRYDLADGPLKLRVPVSQAYTSVSFYTRNGVAYYAINDRAAGRRIIELDLMTARQRAELPDDEEVTAADRLIVESPTPTGLIVVRALAPEPGLMPMARRALAAAQCAS